MNYKLHTNSRMFLNNPYVVRVCHKNCQNGILDLTEFRGFLKKAKNEINATWGYSNPIFEHIGTQEIAGAISSTPFTLPAMACHSYWVFTDEADALQFKLSAGESVKMYMWPAGIRFTIFEFNTTQYSV